MNFNSIQFLMFLPVVLILFYVLPRKARNPLLLMASYIFYMWWSPAYALLMLGSTLATYLASLLSEIRPERKKLWITLCFSVNLSILFFFKYFNFSLRILGDIGNALGLSLDTPVFNVLLPVGISFYTFQALGYTLDVYRGQIKAERNFFTYALFVSFFPQLVAGPIERSGNLLSQFKKKCSHGFLMGFQSGMFLILWGFFKKMVISDNLAVIVNSVYGSPNIYSWKWLSVATVAFAFQIYCDFSAYSDIARGTARLFGFELMLNFKQPYFSSSITEFWRRWHISLSTWFKDYLYFPLGGNRKGFFRALVNIMVVFTVSGLWHGAALTFVFWGMLNGLLQVLERVTKKFRDALRLPKIFCIAITFALTCFCWIFFRANSTADAFLIVKSIFSMRSGAVSGLTAIGTDIETLIMCVFGVAVLIGFDIADSRANIGERINKTIVLRYCVYFLLLVCILIFGSYGSGYDPQEFVYFQF
ncbi:MAG: MBOAT family protein [Oscillospiraceae bacterium]|jgi:D-alanyl-lipoteichoic acid acyltransferase DltB (MBOAT superfamily)|nr:MBOAT family protein [Oscillospiraceae bacterium]